MPLITAGQRAAELVRVESYPADAYDRNWRVEICGLTLVGDSRRESAKRDADHVRSLIAQLLLAHERAALDAGLPPPALSAEELEGVRGRCEAHTYHGWETTEAIGGLAIGEDVGQDVPLNPVHLADFIDLAIEDRRRLLAHIDHLNGLIRDLASDNVLAHYRRGYDDGVKAEAERAINCT